MLLILFKILAIYLLIGALSSLAYLLLSCLGDNSMVKVFGEEIDLPNFCFLCFFRWPYYLYGMAIFEVYPYTEMIHELEKREQILQILKDITLDDLEDFSKDLRLMLSSQGVLYSSDFHNRIMTTELEIIESLDKFIK